MSPKHKLAGVGTAIAALLGTAGLNDTAFPCGGLFCQQVPIDQAGEQIIFRQDGDVVTAIILIQYVGDAEDFSWVVPVPGIPELSTGSDLVFGPLESATRPQFNLITTGDACPIAATKVFLETSMFGDEFTGQDGQFVICGPDAHRDRKWWADCKVVNGNIVEVS